jgi:polycomb protein EED
MMITEEKHPFILPKLKYHFTSEPQTDGGYRFYDIKFWPYRNANPEEPIFAVAAQKKIYIGRLSEDPEIGLTLLQELHDEQAGEDPEKAGLNSCAWCYIDPSQPLLAVAGGSGLVKIIDVLEGTCFTVLVGHGHGTINDIATHPRYPWLVATASMDKSIRIWDLRRYDHRHESPTIVICGQGTGHAEGVLTISWHSSGRYLASGGHDQRVCVWTIPDLSDSSPLWKEISPEYRKRSSNEVKIIYYPHFISMAVHTAFVDCIKFFGDLIISRAADELRIVLWKITGFDSSLPPPRSATAPKTQDYLDTRNGFLKRITTIASGVETIELDPQYVDTPPYERLLEFRAPFSEVFYLRFGLLLPSERYPDLHPTLTFGNAAGELRFWDLSRLSLGHAGGVDEKVASTTTNKKRKGGGSGKKKGNNSTNNNATVSTRREEGAPSSTTNPAGPSRLQSPRNSTTLNPEPETSIDDSPFPLPDRILYPIHDPHRPLDAHARIEMQMLQYKSPTAKANKTKKFTARAVDWSPCGKWCIVAGESGEGKTKGWGGLAVFGR